MVKKLLKIMSVVVIIALCIAGMFFYSIFVSVERVNIHYENITSPKIPESMENVSIAFISDIYFGPFMTHERLSAMVNKVIEVHPDIIVFAGDMFQSNGEEIPSEQATTQMIELLNKLEAPLGKFAVLGEQDLANDAMVDKVNNILYASNFEIITNKAVRLRNQDSKSVTLIGLDSIIGGTPDYTTAFENVNAEEFNIVVTHAPDIADVSEMPFSSIDYILSGHSLGGQIYIPLLGPFDALEGSKHYNHGSYDVNNAKMIVSNGLGTTRIDMRLFAPPQVPIYRLHHGDTPTT